MNSFDVTLPDGKVLTLKPLSASRETNRLYGATSPQGKDESVLGSQSYIDSIYDVCDKLFTLNGIDAETIYGQFTNTGLIGWYFEQIFIGCFGMSVDATDNSKKKGR